MSLALLSCVAVSAQGAEPMPVSAAAKGFPAELGYRLRDGFSFATAYLAGDANLYYYLHWEEFVPHYTVRRGGPVRELPNAPLQSLGRVKAGSSLGEQTLDVLLADPRSRVQGFVVVHRGKVVYEKYPGMRSDDHHLWFSSSKSLAGLLVGMLEAEGKLSVDKPIETYLPELARTQWAGIRIIDILDMASGLDLVETEASRNDPASDVHKYFRLDMGDGTGLGSLTPEQVLLGIKKKGPAGKVFEYSSLDTQMLGRLIERVSGQRLGEMLSERVWSRMGAEGDALVGVSPQGSAGIYGIFSSRLRDMARYGMLYTPSWRAVASAPVVPVGLLEKIQKNCRPALYQESMRNRPGGQSGDVPRCNSRHWDAVYADGDIFKGGARGQGLYVSPSRDAVVVWFSTNMEGAGLNHARAAVLALPAAGG